MALIGGLGLARRACGMFGINYNLNPGVQHCVWAVYVGGKGGGVVLHYVVICCGFLGQRHCLPTSVTLLTEVMCRYRS